jgi:hypothetical protein
VFWGLPLLCGGLAVQHLIRRRERWQGESAVVLSLVVVAVLVNASFLRQSLDVRVSDAVVPAALLGAWALGLCWMPTWRNRPSQGVMQFATVAIVLIAGTAAARVAGLAGQYDESGLPQGLRGVRAHAGEVVQMLRAPHRQDIPSRYSLALRPFFEYIDRCSSTSDRLIVTGEFPDVLVLARRKFAGDGIVFGSWYSSVTHQDRTIARLRADPALFVLHMGDAEGFRMKYGQVADYVDQEYREMAEVPVEEGGVIEILVHTSRAPNGTDGATGWTCFLPPRK